MGECVFLGIGRVLPEDVEALRGALAAGSSAAGVVFLDPEDGVHPLALVPVARSVRPEWPVVVPLVARDRNRTALLAEARAARVVGADGLLLVAGRLEAPPTARPVFEMDVLQLAGWLREQGVDLELWTVGRCATPAQRAWAGAVARAGVARLVVPWEGGALPRVDGLEVVPLSRTAVPGAREAVRPVHPAPAGEGTP